MTTSPELASRFAENTVLPTADYTGRRLVLVSDSFNRIITLQPRWWESDDRKRQSYWNGDSFAELIDATMAPDSVMVVDLTRKHGDHHTHMYLSTLLKLGRSDEMLNALHGKIGLLRIHYGYDLRTDVMPSIDFDCGGSSNSIVHLIAGDVWHDLFQLYHNRNVSMNADWVSVLASLTGLLEPIQVLRDFGPLVGPGFKCPFDEIVKVEDGYWRFQRGSASSLTAYPTVRTED